MSTSPSIYMLDIHERKTTLTLASKGEDDIVESERLVTLERLCDFRDRELDRERDERRKNERMNENIYQCHYKVYRDKDYKYHVGYVINVNMFST